MTSAHTPRKVLIIGATGEIGTHITNSIVREKSHFEEIAIFTSPDIASGSNKARKIKGLEEHGVKIIYGDVKKGDDLRSAFKDYDTVVCCLGRGALSHQEDIIKIAIDTPGLKRFFPSEYGTDIGYDEASPKEKPARFKVIARRALEAAADEGKIEYTYLVSGPYADGDRGMYLAKGKATAYGFFDVPGKKAAVAGDGNGKISLSSMKDTGNFVAAALLHPEASRNKSLTCNSFTTTPNEIVAEFEKQTGGSKWDVSYISIDKLKDLEDAAWERQDPAAASYTLRRIWATGKTLYARRSNADIEAEDNLDTLESAVRQTVKPHQS